MTDIIDFFKMIKNAKCPSCAHNFKQEDIDVIRCEDEGITIAQVNCSHCSKSFALGIFGLNKEELKKMFFCKETLKPISYDEILDLHKTMPSFEKKFYEYLKKRELK